MKRKLNENKPHFICLNPSEMEQIVGGSNCAYRYAACGAGLALSFSTGAIGLGLMFLPSTLAICAYAGNC